jgi:DNA-binding LacI/PurR family transcriptional regulator
MAAAAIHFAIDQRDDVGGEEMPPDMVLPPSLVVRDSSGPASSG